MITLTASILNRSQSAPKSRSCSAIFTAQVAFRSSFRVTNTVICAISSKKSGLDACFTHINGADNRRAESKHDRIEAAVSGSGFDKSECVIIGDTEHEYQIASSLGVPCILVGWGHRPGEELIKCKCGYAGTVSELYGLLFENG
ncbi:MAG: HAD hydrolase-like protein [Clostridia bacterium]|nr:HAD hydrolase-like protein [Clostridia bacterium]